MRSAVIAIVVSALAVWTSMGSLARAASFDDAPRVLVRFDDRASASERANALEAIGAVVESEIPELGIARVIVGAGYGGTAAATALAAQPGVLSAETDGAVRLALVPNDSFFLMDPYSGVGQWGLRTARVDRAWDLARGSADVVVATIDTGVDPGHPDLAGALLPPAHTLSSVSSGCQLGPLDDSSHGTHIAGIIAAKGGNGVGIAGVAFGVKLLSIKALDCTGRGVVSDVARAIVYAADRGARVVNISLGTASDSFVLRDAVRYAQGKGVLIVAAAGNCALGGSRCAVANQQDYPGAYPGVLAVAATSNDDTRATFSTQASYVDIAAPGVRVVSTTPTYATFLSAQGVPRSYAALSGTSQAAPFVAGVAALIASQEPSLPAAKIAERVLATADDLGVPGLDTAFGAGRVNALRAISAPGGTYGAVYDSPKTRSTVAAGASFPATVKVTNTSNFAWTARGTTRLSYHWIDASGRPSVWDGTRTMLPADLPINASVDLPATVTAPATPGRYTLRFDMVREGVTWFSGARVRTADVPLAITTGYDADYAVGAGLAAGSQGSLAITVTNTGELVWPAAGQHPVRLSYHWVAPNGSVVVWDGPRAALPRDLLPGSSLTLALPVLPPARSGAYLLRLDLVQEGQTWFSARGVVTCDVPYAVTSGSAAAYVAQAPC